MVDLADEGQVLQTVQQVLGVLGLDPLLELVAQVPGVLVEPGRAAGVFRAARPATVSYDDRVLAILPWSVTLHHVVHGVRLDSAPVPDLDAHLTRLLMRALGPVRDFITAQLTALRDAVTAAG